MSDWIGLGIIVLVAAGAGADGPRAEEEPALKRKERELTVEEGDEDDA